MVFLMTGTGAGPCERISYGAVRGQGLVPLEGVGSGCRDALMLPQMSHVLFGSRNPLGNDTAFGEGKLSKLVRRLFRCTEVSLLYIEAIFTAKNRSSE